MRGKMKDWQLPSKWIRENLPVCPVCKKRVSWETYQDVGFFSLSKYQFVCTNCEAMLEIPCVGIDSVAVMTGLTGLIIRGAKSDTKELKLVNAGTHPDGEKFLNKSGKLQFWQEVASHGSFCGKCGNPLAENEKFCPKCGAKRE